MVADDCDGVPQMLADHGVRHTPVVAQKHGHLITAVMMIVVLTTAADDS